MGSARQNSLQPRAAHRAQKGLLMKSSRPARSQASVPLCPSPICLLLKLHITYTVRLTQPKLKVKRSHIFLWLAKLILRKNLKWQVCPDTSPQYDVNRGLKNTFVFVGFCYVSELLCSHGYFQAPFLVTISTPRCTK